MFLEAALSGPLAQLVEQLTFNQWVAGSNPARLTTYQRCDELPSLTILIMLLVILVTNFGFSVFLVILSELLLFGVVGVAGGKRTFAAQANELGRTT